MRLYTGNCRTTSFHSLKQRSLDTFVIETAQKLNSFTHSLYLSYYDRHSSAILDKRHGTKFVWFTMAVEVKNTLQGK